jgi:benzodiazapine receptor
MSKDSIRQIVNALAVLGTIVMNGLANALPLNGQLTGEISDRFRVFFVPAGYVFSIWGLIYIGLLAFAVFQALPSQRQNAALRRIGYWPTLSGVANVAWLFLWHYNLFGWTLVAMLLLLASLLAIYMRLGIGRSPAAGAGERWAVRLPFSIYLGWITVATLANVTDVLYLTVWDGFGIGPETWAAILLVLATLVAVAMAVTRRDAAYILVLTWAFAGIAVAQAGVPLVSNVAWITAAATALLAAWASLRGKSARGAATLRP